MVRAQPSLASRVAAPVAWVPRSKLWIEQDGEVVLSDWRVALLQVVDATGSLSEAARRMDVPYRTAWYKLKEIEERIGTPLLETRSGGATGGSSQLTPAGRDLVARFDRFMAGLDTWVAARFRAEFGDLLG
jgi:molybdate transport system regulatory protein